MFKWFELELISALIFTDDFCLVEMSHHLCPNNDLVTVTKISTCHDNGVVMAFVQTCNDLIVMEWIKTRYYIYQIKSCNGNPSSACPLCIQDSNFAITVLADDVLAINSSPPGQNGRHFGRQHFQMHYLDNNPALV